MKRVFAHIGFSFGIALICFNLFGTGFAKLAGVVLAAVFAVSLASEKLRREAAVPLCAGSALFACCLFLFCVYSHVQPQLELGGRTADAVFYLTGLGQKSNTGYVYTAIVKSVNLPGAPQGIKIRLYSTEPIPAAGYQLLEGRLKFFISGTDGYSSYGAWGKGVFVSAKQISYTRLDEFVSSPMTKILELRYNISRVFTDVVGGDEGALGSGLLIGDRSQMSDRILTAFKLTGSSHLTAVSGLHLSAITGVFAYLFKRIRLSKKISYPILIAIIIFYCTLSGFSKSVVRAGIMLSLVLIAEVFKRRADSLNSLGFALLIICLNPFAVCDISTLLTVLSILAIVTVYPAISLTRKFENLKFRIRENRAAPLLRALLGATSWVVEMLLLSLSIVLCNLPVMCLFFGYFSVVGIFINLVLIPLGTIAIIASMLFAVISPFGVIASGFAPVVRALNGGVIRFVTTCSELPITTLNLTMVAAILIGAAMVFIGFCIIIAPEKTKRAAIITAAAVITIIFALNIFDSRQDSILVTENGAAVVRSKEVAVLNVDTSPDYYEVKTYLIRNRLKPDRLINCEDEYAERLSAEFGGAVTDTNSVAFDVDGVEFSAGKNAHGDIVLSNGVLTDKNGTVGLSDGSVLYKVSGGEYRAERYSSSLLT